MSFTSFSQNPQVTTKYGVLEGRNESGVKVFLGVPFAAPPVGDLRWKAPQPVEKWEGVRLAQEFGPNPMQQPIFGDMNFSTQEMSEDCLYLNIWSPSKTMDEKLPVLIYFNGGGLMAGSGSEPRYAGWSMARMGIISITANYREGIFGFFAHPELSAETYYKGSGNYGFLDQLAAIKWVKENISAFGGDPERITIVGESAGSMSVSALMASPLSTGTFAQAMGSSGSVMRGTKIPTLQEAEAAGIEKMKQIGCASLDELRQLSAEELMERAAINNVPIYNIDNYFFVKQPDEVFKNGEQVKVPLLVGVNSCEANPGFILWGKEATYENIKAAASQSFKEKTVELLNLYGITTDSIDNDGLTQLASDLFISFSTWKWGAMHGLTSGQPVYRYKYCHPRPEMVDKNKIAGLAGGVMEKTDDTPVAPKRDSGAVHSADIEYAMGTLPTNRVFNWQAEDYVVSEIFQNYYVNFVKTGNPNGLGLVEWLPTNAQSAAPVLQIDVNTYLKQDSVLEQRYKIIDELWYK